MEKKIPSYRKHSSGQAFVRFGDKQIYLGKYGSEASIARYEKAIAEWLAGVNNDDVATVVELCAAYYQHASTYYTKDGEPTSEIDSIRAAIRKLRAMYGDLDVIEFRPRFLMAYQEAWVQHGLTRGGCNRMVKVVRRIFKWGVSREIVPPDVLGALNAVPLLKKGRTEAPETKRVKPIDLETIQHTMQAMGPTVADMVVLQMLSGCRPGEICRLTPGDVDRTQDPWLYQVDGHKTEHHDKERFVYFGPQAQQILAKYLLRADKKKCFGYTVASYRRHIHRCCQRLGIEKWNPNRIRHTRATEVRAKFGLEHTRAMLGHSHSKITETYAELDQDKARQIAADSG